MMRSMGGPSKLSSFRLTAARMRWRMALGWILFFALSWPLPRDMAEVSLPSALRPAEAESVGVCYTPPRGSAERTAILDALRPMVPETDGRKAIFVVRYLRVCREWAWIEADPQSADGRNRYEPLHCLLRKAADRWVVVEVRPCCGDCEDDPDCRDRKRYFRKLHSRFPQAPAGLFPRE